MAGLKVAVTGGRGTLGRALAALRPDWRYLSRAQCDIRNYATIRDTLEGELPDVVVHAAALTDHAHPHAADIIETNIVGSQYVAWVARTLKARLVYLSTHYVYEGTRGGYTEYDVVRPIGTYAWSKLAGEHAIATESLSKALVVRGSWYTRATRLDAWARRGALTDAWCSREPAADAARKIVSLVEARAWQQHTVVNIGGARRTFAQILRDEGYTGFPAIDRACFNAEGHSAYAFPADTSVDTSRFDALGLDWRGV